jgi:hypothetical protein
MKDFRYKRLKVDLIRFYIIQTTRMPGVSVLVVRRKVLGGNLSTSLLGLEKFACFIPVCFDKWSF